MIEPEDIARMISEDERKCDKCQGDLAADSDSCQTPGCSNFLFAFKSLSGVLKTNRGTVIEFDDLIDRGSYYAVFVPDRYRWVHPWSRKKRGSAIRGRIRLWGRRKELNPPQVILYGGTIKYPQYYSVKNIWPAGDVPAGEPGAYGSYDITRTHKTLTVNKANIVSLRVGSLKVI